MNVLRVRAKLISWFAILAILALVLTPTLARTLSRAQAAQGHWVEVCAHHGVARVALEGFEAFGAAAGEAAVADDQAYADAEVAGQAAQLQATVNLKHCPDCSLASQVLAPPLAHTPQMLSRDASHLAPLFLHAPYTLFAWRGPRTRAPPRIA